MKTQKPREFRWALWWGLGIMVACLAVLIIDAIATMGEPSNGDFGQPVMDVFYSFVYSFGIWPIVAFIGVVVPIYEELIFRLWGNGKDWSGYISVVLMSLFSIGVAKWVAPIILLSGLAIMIVFQFDRKKRLFALMLFSSLVFALVHIGNYNPSENMLIFIIALLHKFSMGLLASYLVINHSILWSMCLHIINNGVMMIFLGIGFSDVANKTTVIKTDDYRITMRPMLFKNQMPDEFACGWINDSVFFDIDSPDFSAEMLVLYGNKEATSIEVQSEHKYYPKMRIKVEMFGEDKDYNAVIRTMEKEGWIALDTVGDTLKIRNTYDPLVSLYNN